mgnify:CR=1 FL=1
MIFSIWAKIFFADEDLSYQKFNDTFKLGHMTATGYLLMSKMIMSYIDWIIRNNIADFANIQFVETDYSWT